MQQTTIELFFVPINSGRNSGWC